MNRPMKNKVVYGNKQGGENMFLKPAKRLFWLFVSGLDQSVDPSAILDYLKSLQESESYVCAKLETRYSTYSSFKVRVPLEMVEGFMHSNLWPKGCIVGKFRSPRNKPRFGVLTDKEHF